MKVKSIKVKGNVKTKAKKYANHFYETVRTGKGKEARYEIKDVEMFAIGAKAPIASVHDHVKKARSVILTRKFAAAAIKRVNEKIEGGYLPPVHVGHNAVATGTIRADVGYFVNLSFGAKGDKKRPDPKVVYCDIVEVTPVQFDAIAQHRLPYRSVEVLNPDKPDFSSVALMQSTPPYLQFKNLRVKLRSVGWRLLEQDIEACEGVSTQKLTSLSGAASVCFSASSEDKAFVLSKFGNGRMIVKKGKKSKKAKSGALKLSASNLGGTKKAGKGGSRIGRLEKQMGEVGQQLGAILAQLQGEGEDATPIVNSAVGGKKTLRKKRKSSGISLSAIETAVKKANAPMRKKLAKFEAEKKTAKTQAKADYIFSAFSDLRHEGYDVDPKAMTLSCMDALKPKTLARKLIKGYKKAAPQYALGSLEEDDNGDGVYLDSDNDKIVALYKGEAAAVQLAAGRAAQEYDDSINCGVNPGMSRKDYVISMVGQFADHHELQLNADYDGMLKGALKLEAA